MPGLCPYCKTMLTRLKLEEMTCSAFMGTQWRGIAYVCPNCQNILNVSIDPIAIKTDIINEIKGN
jgi:hypothetical protein